jgi:transposase
MPPQRKTLSLETRSKLLDSVNVHHLSIVQAATNLAVPVTTARSFFKHYREAGRLELKEALLSQKSILTGCSSSLI